MTVTCEKFREHYPAILKAEIVVDDAGSKAIVDHADECDACDLWADIGCDRYKSLIVEVFSGVLPNNEASARMDDHHNECDACDEAISISCAQFRQYGGLGYIAFDQKMGGIFSSLRAVLRQHEEQCQNCADWSMAEHLRQQGVDPDGFPCVHLAYYSYHQCEQHEDAYSCPDTMLVRDGKNNFSLPVRDGGSSSITISHCPWCGLKTNEG